MTSNEEIQVVVSVVLPIQSKKVTQKELNENRAEKNTFYMALTLCSMSILSRILIICDFIYFFFYNSFSASLTSTIIVFLFIRLFQHRAFCFFIRLIKCFAKNLTRNFLIKTFRIHRTNSNRNTN